MTPDRMRRIDLWIGVPACFLLTILSAVLMWAAGPGTLDEPENVLFIELAEMGSTVIAAPALLRLRERHPGSKAFFLLFKNIAHSVSVTGLVPRERVFTIDASSPWRLLRDTIRFMIDARRPGSTRR